MSIDQYNPATSEKFDEVEITNANHFHGIFKKCRQSQSKWKRYTFKERSKYLIKMKNWLCENTRRITELVSKSNGTTQFGVLGSEVIGCIMAIDWCCKNAKKILKKKSISGSSIFFINKRAYKRYDPIGVVAIISPWNFPLSIPFTEIIMALIAGNGVIFKGASCTVSVSKIIEEMISKAGLPDGLFNHIVYPGAEFGELLIANGVDKIFFTGSVEVGKQLLKQTASTLTPIVLELGGNDPMIVLPDCDIERAVNGAIWGAFQNTGQVCAGVERLLVHSKIYQKFIRLVAQKTKKMQHGCPTNKHEVDMGSMSKKSQYFKVLEHLNDATTKGAKIIAQSKPFGFVDDGLFIPATVLINVTEDMDTWKEETFGPLLPIMKFDTIEEAIKIANRSQYTLTASVWTNSNSKGKKIAEKLNAGVVTINDHCYTYGNVEKPWGAYKFSGMGRTHGEEGLKEMCNMKVIDYDIFPSFMLKRNIWWYDFNKKSFEILLLVVKYLYYLNPFKKIWVFLCIFLFMVKKMCSSWDRKKKVVKREEIEIEMADLRKKTKKK